VLQELMPRLLNLRRRESGRERRRGRKKKKKRELCEIERKRVLFGNKEEGKKIWVMRNGDRGICEEEKMEATYLS
jgi:hypothetical protein